MIKHILIIFLIYFLCITNCSKSEKTKLRLGGKIEIDNGSKNNKDLIVSVYNGNSKNLLLASSNDGTFYLYDKVDLHVIDSHKFNESIFISPYSMSAYLEESNGNIFIVVTQSSSKSNSVLYKLNSNFEVINTTVIVNEQVIPNQPNSLMYDRDFSILTFVGSKGIHRFNSNDLSVQSFMNYSQNYNFNVSSISFVNSNLLNIAGKTSIRPWVLRYFLNSFPTKRDPSKIILLQPSIEIPSSVSEIGNLLNFEKSLSFLTKKSDKTTIRVLSHALESNIDDEFPPGKDIKVSVSDGKSFAIYIGGGYIYLYRIGQKGDSESAIRFLDYETFNEDAISAVYCSTSNRFFISTNSGKIIAIDISDPKSSNNIFEQNIYYDLPKGITAKINKHQWWKILFSVIGVAIGVILACGLVSLFIVYKKRHLLGRLLNNINNHNKNNNNNNNNNKKDDGSCGFGGASINNNNEELQNNIIDIDSNNNDNNNNNNNNNNNDEQQQHQRGNGESYEL